MQYLLTPQATPIPPYVWWDGAFSENELNWLQEKAKLAKNNSHVLGGVNQNVRKSQTEWLNFSKEAEFVFKKLADVTSYFNANFFQFDLDGFGEPLQLTNYNQEDNGMYVWHQDYGAPVSRKLSLVLQLTDPSEYEGGNLQVLTEEHPSTIKKQRGLIVGFPSYILHQVTPVTKGSRQSLVAWLSGPKFK